MAASASSRIGAQRRQRQSLFGANARARRLTDTNAGTSTVEFQHSNSCTTCGMEFDIFNRRHHCRHCGLSFCDTHCRQVAASRVSQSDNLFDDLFEESVRLCEECISNMRKGVRGLGARTSRRCVVAAAAPPPPPPTHQADTGASPNSMGDIAEMDDSTATGDTASSTHFCQVAQRHSEAVQLRRRARAKPRLVLTGKEALKVVVPAAKLVILTQVGSQTMLLGYLHFGRTIQAKLPAPRRTAVLQSVFLGRARTSTSSRQRARGHHRMAALRRLDTSAPTLTVAAQMGRESLTEKVISGRQRVLPMKAKYRGKNLSRMC